MAKPWKKYATLAIVLIAVALAGWHGNDYLQDVRYEVLYRRQIATIKKASGVEEVPDFHAKVDRVREFVNAKTEHNMDDEFFRDWRDKSKMAANVIEHLEGRRSGKPHFECSTRADLMAAILEQEGFRHRDVDAFRLAHDGRELEGHAVIDVFNPQTGRWETQDPDYDVYWADAGTGRRATIFEAAIDDAIVPCRAGRCGWKLVSDEGIEAGVLKRHLAYLTAISRSGRDTRIGFHAPELSPDTLLTYKGKTGAYCDLLPKNCKHGFHRASAENLKRIEK